MRLRRLLAMGLGLILVLSMAPPAAGASTSVRHVIRTSAWSVPSPDPTGIDLYNGQLLVTDSEVDETGLNRHRNIWRTTLTGAVRKTMSTLRFSHEPTDVAADPARNVWYFADDTSFGGGRGRIFVKDLGPDRIYGTRDDRRRSFATSPFGSTDPEGLAFGGGHLWISDGSNGSLYRIRPGPNGKIEGAGTDDIITVLDIKGLGANDLEGVEFANGRLFVLPNQKNADILELNPLDGSLLRVFDLSTAGLVNPSGLAFGPSSTNRRTATHCRCSCGTRQR